jgi:hypothetical protein
MFSEKREILPPPAGKLLTPFFPEPYALNSEVYTYVFQAGTQDEFVTISFDDWQLSPMSTITVS